MQKSLVLTLGLVLGSCQGSGSDSVTPAVTVESPTALTGFLNPTESAAIQRVMSKEKAVRSRLRGGDQPHWEGDRQGAENMINR